MINNVLELGDLARSEVSASEYMYMCVLHDNTVTTSFPNTRTQLLSPKTAGKERSINLSGAPLHVLPKS